MGKENVALVAVMDPIHSFFNKLKIFGNKSSSFDISGTSLRLYMYMGLFLFAASAITSSFQLFGTPIHCHIQERIKLNRKLFESMCWIDGVHTILEESDAAKIGGHSHGRVINPPAPGVIPVYLWHDNVSPRKQRYYQWVFLALVGQSLGCFLPCILWGRLEGGRMGRMKGDLKEVAELAASFTRNRWMSQFLFLRFLVCLVVGMLSLLVQMLAVDAFLGGGGFFWNLGFAQSLLTTLYQTPTSTVEVVDPLILLFPRLTKCMFNYYSGNGEIQKVDGICVLPINIFNEKLYTVLWFSFWALFIYSLLTFVGFAVLKLSVEARVMVMKFMLMPPGTDRHLLSAVADCDLGEWFVLYFLGDNLDPEKFRDMVERLGKKTEGNVQRGGGGDDGDRQHDKNVAVKVDDNDASMYRA